MILENGFDSLDELFITHASSPFSLLIAWQKYLKRSLRIQFTSSRQEGDVGEKKNLAFICEPTESSYAIATLIMHALFNSIKDCF